MTAPAIHAFLFFDVDEKVVAGSGLVEDGCVWAGEDVVQLPTREEVKEVSSELLELGLLEFGSEWLVAADEGVDSDCSDEARK
jgi:hypothetical protein